MWRQQAYELGKEAFSRGYVMNPHYDPDLRALVGRRVWKWWPAIQFWKRGWKEVNADAYAGWLRGPD